MHSVWNQHDHGNSLEHSSCCSHCTGNATILTHPSSVMKSHIHCLAALRRKLLHNLLPQLDNPLFPKQAKHANSPDMFNEFQSQWVNWQGKGECQWQKSCVASLLKTLFSLYVHPHIKCGRHILIVSALRQKNPHNQVKLWPVLRSVKCREETSWKD